MTSFTKEGFRVLGLGFYRGSRYAFIVDKIQVWRMLYRGNAVKGIFFFPSKDEILHSW